jgi:hypothetical protein
MTKEELELLTTKMYMVDDAFTSLHARKLRPAEHTHVRVYTTALRDAAH